MRPKTFWIASTPVFVGSSFALAFEGKFNFWTFILTLVGAVLIQAMSNMVNDYAYNLRKAETGTRVGLPRATTEGWISMSAAKKMINTVILLCILFAILLFCIGGWPIALIAFFSILAGYCYMAGPYPLAYTPFGEVLVFLFYGPVAVFGTYWLQTHTFSWPSLVPGAALGLYGAAVLYINNYRDIDHDISQGRKTLPAYVGKKWSYYLYGFMMYVPFIILGWLVTLNEQYWHL
ncbi:MAG: 1,4-dihydroxy-2-naphthoate octaprenyltransferase, partial [Burkholderiales bacterium]|nr:1,4-dihydroxy-2-naphthoate octaprenyltransferase [Burkholderiales bacterium]